MRECINRTKTEAGSIWEVLKRRKLRTFKNQAKTMKVKIQEKVITLREECGLFTRLLILSKSRPGGGVQPQKTQKTQNYLEIPFWVLGFLGFFGFFGF